MNDEELERYINITIIPLFPDMEDTPGNRILLKVDSGPGHNCMSFLVSCRFCGLYLFPGLPNATSVQQETDRNYGLFKKVVRKKSCRTCNELLRAKKADTSIGINLWACHLRRKNKLLNKLSQFLLCTKWIDEGLFDCCDLHHSKVATGQWEHLPDGNVSPFGNNPANQMSGWIASNRLRV